MDVYSEIHISDHLDLENEWKWWYMYVKSKPGLINPHVRLSGGYILVANRQFLGLLPKMDQRHVIISGLKLPLTIDVPTINHGEST